MFAKHSCGDSKLTCIDCSEIICSKCFVQCPVGFRCRNCTAKFSSHLIVVSPWIMARTVLACIALGSIYGFVLPGGMGIFGFVITYFAGALAGKVVHKIAGYKLGKKVVASIVAGLLIGMILSPISAILFSEIMVLFAGPKVDASEVTGEVTGEISTILFTIGPAAIFIFGVLSPILYGYSRRS